ncbi:GNAT family N-acetyltransferase [Streptococcus hyointestinalis]|uniref:GNAT family acetyltransferase n=1 Tax=Streptococcus hyointestinalis TaxID=1337 RepID=A0A380KEN1_9STRE|nr:GNAT family N-acetyltransferase [Streptococcus hyointestinalis]SUN63368.1 GNAT family acetyltransferase [Streptococcus hyointestinalis]
MTIRYTRNTLSDTYLDALRIRQAVFVREQKIPHTVEIDSKEAYCLHFIYYDDDNQALATCRLFPNKDKTEVTLQRMATLSDYRQHGIGRQLLQYVIDFSKKQGFEAMSLHAQLPAVSFYESLGFTTVGEAFKEAGIEHIHMKKKL